MAQHPLVDQGLLTRTLTALRSHSRHITLGRTPLDEWSAQHINLYLRTHNTNNKRQTYMPPAGFEATIPVSQRHQTHALDRAATWSGIINTHYSSECFIIIKPIMQFPAAAFLWGVNVLCTLFLIQAYAVPSCWQIFIHIQNGQKSKFCTCCNFHQRKWYLSCSEFFLSPFIVPPVLLQTLKYTYVTY